jgi:recombinational DNA repair ATPase RecF
MAQRNRLLSQGGDATWLTGLEDAMARHGVAATAARRALVARLDAVLAAGALGGFPAASLSLRDATANALDAGPALAAEDGLRAALRAARNRDRAAGATVEGPHRADLEMVHREKSVPAALCSTGEQKALLVSTVLAHAGLIHAARGFAPIVLLDEVAANLDASRRAALFEALLDLPAQAWLTARASLLAMMGQIMSMMVPLFTSWERMRGEDTMHHAPKCVRASVKLRTGTTPSVMPTSSMSGYCGKAGQIRGWVNSAQGRHESGRGERVA